MMYRVFLQDEKDAPNNFRIHSGEKLAWTHSTGNYIPSLESQLGSMDSGFRVDISQIDRSCRIRGKFFPVET